ncbi:MAG: hypothetical protein OYK82_08850 [Gammaproteobacteria bacterium]|nr:hypothetical protein [Gammaproteobacteria bacterium]
MKKTILCALAALAVSSCGEIPTEAVPADAVPVEGETLAGTETEMQAAADGANSVCEVEYDEEVTGLSGSLTVTVPWRVSRWHPYSVNFTSMSRTGWMPDELRVAINPCRYPFRSFHGGRDYYCHGTAGNRTNGPWQYDSATGKSSSTFRYYVLRNDPGVTEIAFWGAGGRNKGCDFRGRVRS